MSRTATQLHVSVLPDDPDEREYSWILEKTLTWCFLYGNGEGIRAVIINANQRAFLSGDLF